MRRKVLFVGGAGVCLAALLSTLLSQRRPGLQVASQSPAAPSLAVVELFTSEGCSSCPPADELLRRVSEAVPGNGQTVLVLSEHVTYWNNLGWIDPFSQQLFTERQERYVSNLGVPET